ncbi:MAG: hypothetical protein KatS3mg082_1429 [Nitrospiraceae bacterium]|nr:MAG: hypothetical protein KatS3mg082_1429 [Nitrospiraceae bacterium]
MKALGCYRYQSCETPDWEQTEAYQFCKALEGAMVHELIDRYEAKHGWIPVWPIENDDPGIAPTP